MSWNEYYKSRLITADEAAAKIKNGDRIVMGHGAGEPRLMPQALVKRQNELENVVVTHGIALGPGLYCQPDVDHNRIRLSTCFAGGSTRKAVQEGRAAFVAMHFSDVPKAYREKFLDINVAVTHVSPPDRYGYCSLGISVDYERAAIESADLVIAEVNINMPRTYGNTLVHVNDIDYFVESSQPLIVMSKPDVGPVEEAIGRHIASLVEDGATLQLGIGGIPNAILSFLRDKNDLGLHSELLSDGTMELIEAGVINGKRKTLHPCKALATFAAGTSELYKKLDGNPAVEFYPVEYINDSHVISLNDKMFSVNSAIQIDLLGQVCAETINAKQFSGIGGQMDFVRGACLSKGGKAVIAMPATAKNGTVSKIVAALQPGDAVTTPRNDVDYVVTENGIAHLRGQETRERARRLIAIADPKFRDELKSQFEHIYALKL
ncbi:MAG: acetyl-CoA hydrolase/transferase family protein [Firmicutes bacterium]|nr:acetyl-CoA hydrolase/transferase family protein [Bacillota bacterium]